MNRMVISIVALLIVGQLQTVLAVSSASDGNRNTGSSSGVSVDDLGRGLKSAAQNIENDDTDALPCHRKDHGNNNRLFVILKIVQTVINFA